MGPSARKGSLTAAARDAALAGDQRPDARMVQFNRDVDSIDRTIDGLFAKIARLQSALHSCLDYLDGKVDVVDGSYGEPAPNREMSLVIEINEALGRGGY